MTPLKRSKLQPYKFEIRVPDTTKITIVPVVKHGNTHAANTAYVDLHWTPVLGPTAIAIVRWASHQSTSKSVTEHQLATAVGAHGFGDIRRALAKLLNCDLATTTEGTLHIAITFPSISVKRASSLRTTVAANPHRTN